MPAKNDLPYRPGVGIMLLDARNHVFVGQRRDSRLEAWQMPQGGIDAGEEPYAAALRELHEETGVPAHLVRRLCETPHWHSYDLPDDMMGHIWGGRYRGQRQKWFALRFLGCDADVDLQAEAAAGLAEFRQWRWAPIGELCQLIVPFKRAIYEAVIAEILPQLPD